jgi:hypothetical protein
LNGVKLGLIVFEVSKAVGDEEGRVLSNPIEQADGQYGNATLERKIHQNVRCRAGKIA